MNRVRFSLLCGLVWIVPGIMSAVPCNGESPRGFEGISIGDTVAQVENKLGELMPSTCWGASECCSCATYNTIVKNKDFSHRGYIVGTLGQFESYNKDKTIGHVDEICIATEEAGRNIETYLPKYIKDGVGRRWEQCTAPQSVWRRPPSCDESRVIGMVFYGKKLGYIGFTVGEHVIPQITKMMREDKTPNVKVVNYHGTPAGTGYEFDGIVWLTMKRALGEGSWLYTGNSLVIYDDKIMAKVMDEYKKKQRKDVKRRDNTQHFGK